MSDNNNGSPAPVKIEVNDGVDGDAMIPETLSTQGGALEILAEQQDDEESINTDNQDEDHFSFNINPILNGRPPLPSPGIQNTGSSSHTFDVSLAGYPLGLLPSSIPHAILQAADRLTQMLEDTVKKKIQLYTKYGLNGKLAITTCDLTFPKLYASSLSNNQILIERIISPLCQIINSICYLILPELGIITLRNLVIEKNIFNGIKKSTSVAIPFTATSANEIEENLPLIIDTLTNQLEPCSIECKPDQTASALIDIKKAGKLKKILKSKSDSIGLKYNDVTIHKVKNTGIGNRKRSSLASSNSLALPQSKKSKTAETTSKPNKPLKLIAVPKENEPLFTFDSSQPAQVDATDPSAFSAFKYWQLEKVHRKYGTGQGTTIAIIDGGIDPSHPAFQNGQILHFEDFAKSTLNPAVADHGTHCAGIACGNEVPLLSQDSKSVPTGFNFPPGVAPGAKLIVCKTIYFGTEKAIYHSIYYALEWIDQKSKEVDIDVVTLSLGTLKFIPEIAGAITKLVAKNIIVVCSASNFGYKYSQPICFPARLGHVLCIGSHDVHGKPSSFSPVGQQIDFLAPGEGIVCPSNTSHEFRALSGTSCATPAVAGLICLILSYIKIRNPGHLEYFKNHWVMKEILREISTSPGRHSDDMGYGALNPLKFFQQPDLILNSVLTEVILHQSDD